MSTVMVNNSTNVYSDGQQLHPSSLTLEELLTIIIDIGGIVDHHR
jgi:hypothetical protein